MPVKFAFVSHVLPPSWSGQAIAIGRLLRDLPAEQYCLLSCNDYVGVRDLPAFSERLSGKCFHLAAEPQIRGGARLGLAAWANILLRVCVRGSRIARIVRQERCDVVVAATGEIVDLPAAWLASRLARVRFCPYYFDDYVYQWPDARTRGMARWLERRMLRRRPTAIVPNEFMAEALQRRSKARTVIVRNPCERLGPELRLDNLNATKPADDAITYTGAVYHVNVSAFRDLIKVLREPDLSHLKLHLYTAQSPQSLGENGIAAASVTLHEHLPPTRIVEAQRAATVLFLPFAFDSLVPEVIKTSAPGKFSDYLASGVPILAYAPAEAYVSWYVRRYGCGLVVDRNEPQALAAGLRRLVSDTLLRQQIRQNALARARADFDPAQSRDQFLAALEELG